MREGHDREVDSVGTWHIWRPVKRELQQGL